MTQLPTLIATDLDLTLLDASGQVTPRTRAALDAARAAGIMVVPVTARQPVGLASIARQAGFESWAVCANGAFGVHLTTGEMLFAEEIPVATLESLAAGVSEVIPGVRFASVQDAGARFVAQHGYAELAHFEDHKRDPATMGGVHLTEMVAEPSLKLIVRHPELPLPELYARVNALGLTGFETTLSGAPFVEVSAEGITKASGLAALCEHLGIDQGSVIAFGDGLNDLEMLAWAGRGFAMANASEEVRAAADEVAESHADDGVARVIERLLAGEGSARPAPGDRSFA